MKPFLAASYGNPSSGHWAGARIRRWPARCASSRPSALDDPARGRLPAGAARGAGSLPRCPPHDARGPRRPRAPRARHGQALRARRPILLRRHPQDASCLRGGRVHDDQLTWAARPARLRLSHRSAHEHLGRARLRGRDRGWRQVSGVILPWHAVRSIAVHRTRSLSGYRLCSCAAAFFPPSDAGSMLTAFLSATFAWLRKSAPFSVSPLSFASLASVCRKMPLFR
jgi:hypothetical protein